MGSILRELIIKKFHINTEEKSICKLSYVIYIFIFTNALSGLSHSLANTIQPNKYEFAHNGIKAFTERFKSSET